MPYSACLQGPQHAAKLPSVLEMCSPISQVHSSWVWGSGEPEKRKVGASRCWRHSASGSLEIKESSQTGDLTTAFETRLHMRGGTWGEERDRKYLTDERMYLKFLLEKLLSAYFLVMLRKQRNKFRFRP